MSRINENHVVDRKVERTDNGAIKESKRQTPLMTREPLGRVSTENQIDRRAEGDLMKRWRMERSWEQVVTETGGDYRERLVVCGLLTLEASCLVQEQVDHSSGQP